MCFEQVYRIYLKIENIVLFANFPLLFFSTPNEKIQILRNIQITIAWMRKIQQYHLISTQTVQVK